MINNIFHYLNNNRYLYRDSLNGTIPESIGNLTNLKEL